MAALMFSYDGSFFSSWLLDSCIAIPAAGVFMLTGASFEISKGYLKVTYGVRLVDPNVLASLVDLLSLAGI